MLKWGRNEKKWLSAFLFGHERQKLFPCIFIQLIRLQASSRISMRKLSVYDGWIRFSILLTLFSERMSAPLRKHMLATMDQPYVKLPCQFQFVLLKFFNISGSFNKILALTLNICCVDVHDAGKRLRVEIIAWMFHSIYSGILLGEMQRCLVE